MVRRLVAGLVVVGLAIGVWALWPQGEPEPSPATTVNAVDSTTSTTPVTFTTSTTLDSHVVTTVEEAEEILRQLWFGWFEGIYNQDEDRIKEVVGTQVLVESAQEAFSSVSFTSAPQPEAFIFGDLEILESSEECLVLWVSGEAPFLDAVDRGVESVEVLRRRDESWVLISSWQYRDDLWEADCVSVLEPLS